MKRSIGCLIWAGALACGCSSSNGPGAAAAGSAGESVDSGGAGSGGSASLLVFRDDFASLDPAWHFDTTDPSASYTLESGVLAVTGGSLQAFGWLDLPALPTEDLEVEIGFRITSGLTGGAVVRGDSTNADGYNCNLREDLDELRAARHEQRNYLTLASAPKSVELGVDYVVTSRIVGDTLTCTEGGGTTVSLPEVQRASGKVGFYVYQGRLELDWFELRRATQ